MNPLRIGIPAVLVCGEFLALSLWVDLPTAGPALGLVEALRVAIPVALGAGIAGHLLAQGRSGALLEQHPLPAWRPAPALVAQPFAFAATAVFAVHLLGAGRPAPGAAALSLLLLLAAVTVLVALAIAAPLRWWAAVASHRWRGALLALALGALSWRAAAAAEEMWGPLSWMTLHAAAWLLQPAGAVTLDPGQALLGLNGFEVTVAPICSGVSGIGLVVTFLAIWLALAQGRLRPWRALVLFPAGVLLALAANVLRIVTLIAVGAFWDENLAVGGFHSKLGWALFAVVALGLVAVAERVHWFRRPEAPAAELRHEPPDTSGLVPLVATLAAALVTGIFATGPFDSWYGVRIAAGLVALAALRRRLPSLAPSRSPWPALAGVVVGLGWVLVAARGGGSFAELARLAPLPLAAWLLVRVLGSVIVIPVVEELAFRGFLLGWLGRLPAGAPAPRLREWPWMAVLVSSAAFGAMHAGWMAGAAAGLAFAGARLWRGRLGDAVVTHAAANAVVAAAALCGRWDLWTG